MKSLVLQYVIADNMARLYVGQRCIYEHRGTLRAISNLFQAPMNAWQEEKWGYWLEFSASPQAAAGEAGEEAKP